MGLLATLQVPRYSQPAHTAADRRICNINAPHVIHLAAELYVQCMFAYVRGQLPSSTIRRHGNSSAVHHLTLTTLSLHTGPHCCLCA
jgi:hypothetical protein